MAIGEPSGASERAAPLLREAHLLKMRGKIVEAEMKCREALLLEPEDATGLEMLGDLLAEKGSLKEAAATYRQALERAPGRVVLEEKYARAALALGEQQHQRAMAQMLLDNPRMASSERRPRPLLAFLLSALWPGLGQLYNEEYAKGLAMAAGALAAILLGGDSLVRLLFAATGSRVAPSSMESVFGVIFLLLWLASVVDAPARAQKLAESRARGVGLL